MSERNKFKDDLIPSLSLLVSLCFTVSTWTPGKCMFQLFLYRTLCMHFVSKPLSTIFTNRWQFCWCWRCCCCCCRNVGWFGSISFDIFVFQSITLTTDNKDFNFSLLHNSKFGLEMRLSVCVCVYRCAWMQTDFIRPMFVRVCVRACKMFTWNASLPRNYCSIITHPINASLLFAPLNRIRS